MMQMQAALYLMVGYARRRARLLVTGRRPEQPPAASVELLTPWAMQSCWYCNIKSWKSDPSLNVTFCLALERRSVLSLQTAPALNNNNTYNCRYMDRIHARWFCENYRCRSYYICVCIVSLWICMTCFLHDLTCCVFVITYYFHPIKKVLPRDSCWTSFLKFD